MDIYMGLDIGHSFISGMIMDSNNKIIKRDRVIVGKRLFKSVDRLISILSNNGKYRISSIGVTGVDRVLVGKYLENSIVKNEIEVLGVGAFLCGYNVDMIIYSDMDDVKVIYLDNGSVIDYYIRDIIFNEDVISVVKDIDISKRVLVSGSITRDKDIINKLKYLCKDSVIEVDYDNKVKLVGISKWGSDKGVFTCNKC